MAIRNFPSDLGWTPGGTFSDSGPLNVGTSFALTANANITGVRFYSPTTQTVAGQLWANGTKVAETTGFSATAGWNTITFSSPYAGTTGVDYIVSALGATTVGYTALAGQFSAGSEGTEILVTVGPAQSNTVNNALYAYSATLAPFNRSVTGAWFGVDAIVDDLEPGQVTAVKATGTGAAVPPAVSSTGNNATVIAVKATGAGVAVPPVVSTPSTSVTVTAVKATGSGSAVEPTVDVTTTLTGGGPATGTGAAIVPSVSVIGGLGQVAAVKATGTGAARVPVVTGVIVVNATVTAVKATGSGAANAPGVTVVETLPTNTQTGRVTGRFATGKVLVGDVDGIANLYPITDRTITFTSTAPVLLNATAEPSPIVIELDPIVCTLNVNGYLVDTAGHQYVDLIATNDTDLTPISRKWRVTPGAGFAWAAFEMTLAAGATVDLVTVIPT